MANPIFNWQQRGWPKATVNRAALGDELKAFGAAFRTLKKALKKPQDLASVVSSVSKVLSKNNFYTYMNLTPMVWALATAPQLRAPQPLHMSTYVGLRVQPVSVLPLIIV